MHQKRTPTIRGLVLRLFMVVCLFVFFYNLSGFIVHIAIDVFNIATLDHDLDHHNSDLLIALALLIFYLIFYCRVPKTYDETHHKINKIR